MFPYRKFFFIVFIFLNCITQGYGQRKEDMHPLYIYLNNELHENEQFVAFEKQYPRLLAPGSHPGFADSIYTYGLLADYYNKYGYLDRADSIIEIMDHMTSSAHEAKDPAAANYEEMLLSTRALNLAYKGDYHGSIEKLNARKTTPRSPSQVNQWLGEIYFRGGQYARAERYLAQSIDSFKQTDLINRWPVDAYVFSANALIKLGRLTQALDRLNKAKYYKTWVKKYRQRFLYNYYNAWIDYLLAVGSQRLVVEPYYQKLTSLTAMQAMPQLILRKAEYESLFGDKNKVIPLLNQSLNITLKNQSSNISLLSNIHLKLAAEYQVLDSTSLAKMHISQAIRLFTGIPDYKDWPFVSWQSIYNRMDVLAALEMYFRFSKIEISVSSDTTALIDHALLAKWAMDGILAERSKFLIGDDKSALVGYNQKIIEQGIYTNTRLFKLTQNPQYLHALFEFIESNKSLNLAEEIVRVNTFNKSYATTNYETDKIDSLKNILVSLDRRKIYEPNNVNLISRIANIHDSLDRWTNQLPFLNNESTQNLQLFKTYSLHEVLHSLTKNQSILEFYQGLDMIYILLMQTNKLDIKAIPRSKDLDEQIQYYHLALTAPIHTDYSFNPRALDSLYQVSATRLFQVLIGDWESILRGQILIIPDGNFHLIPFASLLIQKSTSSNFKEMPYWVCNHAINYEHSSSIWMQLNRMPSDHALQSVLAMAPFASQQLKESQYELEQISRYTLSKSIFNHQATKQLFCQIAPDYKILHLATHAFSNTYDGSSSSVSFYRTDTFLPTTDSRGGHEVILDSFSYLLDVRDVRNLNLQSDMVVLSACESGVGEWKEGEGLISLARGFLSAGAKSVVQTLWQVHDKANALLMSNFYKQLKNGETKGEALRKAQLIYIRDQEIGRRQSHPFYWAGLVIQGNNLPLEKNNHPIAMFLGLLLLTLLILYILRIRKNRHITVNE